MTKTFDLEQRTFLFAKDVRVWVKGLKPNSISADDKNQLIRSSGSVGANYMEANEGLSKRDFVMRIRICKKEAKECLFWLRLLRETNVSNKDAESQRLMIEAIELGKIFGAIIKKCVMNQNEEN